VPNLRIGELKKWIDVAGGLASDAAHAALARL
jgi:hypothetical protein